jgi:hypothetical protein
MVETEGVIVLISTGVGTPQRTTSENALRVLFWLVLFFFLSPIVMGLWMAGMLMSSGSRPSFLSRVAERVLGYWLGIKIWNRSTVPVQNLRVRETRTARIRLVRVAGHLVAGNFSHGDRITVRGEDHHGTILFREGVNHSIQSRILIR